MQKTAIDGFLEDILKLASNTTIVLDAQRIATYSHWTHLGCDGIYLWGEFKNDTTTSYDKTPKHVVIDLALIQVYADTEMCTCQQWKPCIHSIGLLMLYQAQNKLFTATEPPAFVQDWLSKKVKYRIPERNVFSDIRGGLSQLDLWLTNLIRYGLAQPHVREFSFWDEMADRMLAAWMPGLSQWLRDIANIPVRGGEWTEPLLEELSRLYLLVKSFERFEELPFETQADLREVVGWRLTHEDLDTAAPVRNHWLILGRQKRILRNQIPEQITWLYGIQSGRMGVLHDIGSKVMMKSARTTVGDIIDAELVYLPSRAPLNVLLVQDFGEVSHTEIRGGSIEDSIVEYGRALAANPWLKHYPMLLSDVYVSRFDRYWIVRHADGAYLPLAPYFKHKWVMYAASHGYPVMIAGTWNGSMLFPLSVISHDGAIDLNTVMSYT